MEGHSSPPLDETHRPPGRYRVSFSFSLGEKLGVLIDARDIARALKKLYDLAWSKAAELDLRLR